MLLYWVQWKLDEAISSFELRHGNQNASCRELAQYRRLYNEADSIDYCRSYSWCVEAQWLLRRAVIQAVETVICKASQSFFFKTVIRFVLNVKEAAL
ncbi:MAG: hypothetical protein ACKERG_00515 [Candidatus Hodgkinia cicadicola]